MCWMCWLFSPRWSFHGGTDISSFIKLYTLNVHGLFYVNYSIIKIFKNKVEERNIVNKWIYRSNDRLKIKRDICVIERNNKEDEQK